MNETLSRIFSAESRKAWGSGLAALLGSMQLVMISKGYTSVTDLNQLEWVGVAVTVLGSFGITYNLSNEPVSERRWAGIVAEHNRAATPTDYPVDTNPDVPATINTIGT